MLTSKTMTNIYHVSYTPQHKEISLFFWGCNFYCLGCLCLKENRNFLLTENLHLTFEEYTKLAPAPNKFLSMDELTAMLDKLDFERVLLEGQEASLDPQYGAITAMLHERYRSYNTLCSNLYKLPDLSHTDAIATSIKTIDEKLHQEYTGKSNKTVLENIEQLYKEGKKLTVASVFIPDYIDMPETEAIAKYIASVDKNILYTILPYFKSGDNPWRHPTPEEMQTAEKVAKQYLNRVHSFIGNEEMECEVVKVY